MRWTIVIAVRHRWISETPANVVAAILIAPPPAIYVKF
jgi:hypothetical protein